MKFVPDDLLLLLLLLVASRACAKRIKEFVLADYAHAIPNNSRVGLLIRQSQEYRRKNSINISSYKRAGDRLTSPCCFWFYFLFLLFTRVQAATKSTRLKSTY